MIQQKNCATLKSRWKNLAETLGLPKNYEEQLFQDIINQYSAQNRYYHNLTHLEQILDSIDELKSYTKNYLAIQFAAWYHDYYYDTKKTDNEERSAMHAVSILKKFQVEPDFILQVEHLIMATKNHKATNGSPDEMIIIDSDLANMGSEAEVYDHNVQEIRKEFSWVDGEYYKKKRIEFLKNLLNRHRIYLTDIMYQRLEKNARMNINEEIQRHQKEGL